MAPETVKPVPVTVAEFTVTDAVPEEVKVSEWVDGVLMFTSPKAMVVALTVSVGVPVPSCKAKLSAALPALAVRVAVCAVPTDETVAVKFAVVEPAATVTEAGTVTDELLLARLTVKPPLGAAALSATVQESVPAPVIDPLAQLNEDRFVVGAGAASCRAKLFVTPLALAVNVAVCAVLTDETVPVNVALLAPAAMVTVAGTVTAELLLARLTVKPPLGAAALNATVQESVPAPVIDPLAQLNEDRFVVGAGAASCRTKLFVTPLALAVNVAVCAVLTDETVPVNVALLAPAAMVTVAGTVTAELLLARLTVKPPLGAAALNATVQESVPAPVIDPLAQLNEDRFVVGAGAASCRTKLFVTPLALAVNVAVCAVLTDETVAVNVALLAPAAMVTVAGTVTAELLLARLTVKPPLGAAALSATVQEAVPAPVIDPLAQLNEDRFVTGAGAGAAAPSCRAKVSVTPLALAVRVTVCAVLTEETVAAKVAVVEPAATVTEAGTVTDELLLARLTLKPPLGAAALSATVQESVPAPVIDPLAQLSEDRFVAGAGADAAAPSCRAKVSVTPLALAVRVTVCAVLTEVTVAAKVAVVEPAATVTEAGTVTDELLLAKLTANPPLGAAALSATVQESVPAPVIDPLAQLNEDRFVAFVVLAAVPVALSPMSLPPPQPDRANGRQHKTRKRRNAHQRRNCTMCARKRASCRSGRD